MADVTKDIDFRDWNNIPLTKGFFGKTNKMPYINEQPFEIFHFTTDSDGATNQEFQSVRLRAVVGGAVYNITDDAWVTDISVAPKSSDGTIAVATGTFGNSKVYLIFAIGQSVIT